MTSFRSSDSEDTTKKCVCDKDSSQVEYLEHVHSPDAEGACLLDDSIENTVVGRVAWLITFALSTGGFLFGYDTGVISAVLVTVSDSLSPGRNLSSSESELITSITSAGAFVGAIAAGLCADAYGRKLGIYVGCVFFFIGSILQATSWSIAQMVIGRFVVGVGVGEAAMVVPLYIGELAPAKVRGKMIAFDNMSVTLGQLVSYALGAGFTHVGAGWRYMVGLGAVPAIILAATLPLCPESPRQLVAKGKLSEAGAALRKVFPEATDAQVAGKIAVIQGGMKKEQGDGRGLWWQYKQLHCVAGNLRALIAACTVMAISQLGGFNTLMYYSSTLFALVGFNNPTAVSIVVGGTNFIFTVFSMLIIDRLGRRRTLLITVIGMSISLVVTAVAFNWIPVTPELTLADPNAGVGWPAMLVLVTIIIYIAFYASGCATIGWVGTELMPLEVRALGTMINAATCWGCNIIIASTFLTMMKSITPSGAFGFYAGICFFGWVFVIFCYPEVKGLPLESIRDIFKDDFGVEKARIWQKDLKAQRAAEKRTDSAV